MKALIKENETKKTRRTPAHEHGGGYQRTDENEAEASKENSGAGKFSKNGYQPSFCH